MTVDSLTTSGYLRNFLSFAILPHTKREPIFITTHLERTCVVWYLCWPTCPRFLLLSQGLRRSVSLYLAYLLVRWQSFRYLPITLRLSFHLCTIISCIVVSDAFNIPNVSAIYSHFREFHRTFPSSVVAFG